MARSDAPEGQFSLLHNELLPSTTREFTDTSFLEGARNYYVVQAVVSDLTLTEEAGTITLNWAYEGMNEETFFVIFRTDNQRRFKTHRRAEGLSFSELLRGNGPVSYAVRTHTTDGRQSPISEVVTYKPK